MKISLVAALGALTLAGAAHAGSIPYSNAGTENPITYAFVAAGTGDITAYFYGSTASYTNDLTMSVNGVATGIEGLNNHTSPYGLALNLGTVNAGDSLVFELNIISQGGVGPWYSDKSLNADGVNHVYSTNFAGDGFIPAGTFVSFEDVRNGGDFNYNDEDFVFTNVTTAVPEPGSLLLLAIGIGGLLIARRKTLKI